MDTQICQQRLQQAGEAYPRTCPTCGFGGPCKFYVTETEPYPLPPEGPADGRLTVHTTYPEPRKS